MYLILKPPNDHFIFIMSWHLKLKEGVPFFLIYSPVCNLLPCSLVFFLLFSNNWSKTGSFFGCNLPSLHKCYLFKHSQYSKLPDCDYSLIFWSNACIIHCPPAHPQKTHYVHRWFIMFILNEWISFYFWHCQAIYLEDNFFLFSSSSSHFFYHLLLKILVFNSVG